MTWRLADLIDGIPCRVIGDAGVRITDIAYHSARVRQGSLFVAIEGFRVSGTRFIEEAVSRGAAAVAVQEGAEGEAKAEGGREVSRHEAESANEDPGHTANDPAGLPRSVSRLVVPSARQFLARVASRFYGDPSRALELVGITGTNGKTTTAYLLRAACRHRGFEPGLVGTIEYSDGRATMPAGATTPESLDLVRLLHQMVLNRVPVCVAEVSSHALALDRVFGLDFRVGVFTNLTQDHLDFHRTQEEYRAAKMKLFAALAPSGTAVVNLDDPAGADIPALTCARILAYGTGKRGGRPDILGRVSEVRPDGLRASVSYRGREFGVRLQLVGRHNLMNLLAAFGVGVALGWEPEEVLRGVETLDNVPGRLERIENDRGFNVYVDYAHTPDALERVLETVREFTAGRVLVVFGCGGDRDRAKRPLMGQAVARGADVAVVTSDNPRSEDPEAIIREIVSGMAGPVRPLVLPDRERAIARALGEARPGDSVVIAGKGHEDYQLVGNERRQFDDRLAARRLLGACERVDEPAGGSAPGLLDAGIRS